MLVKNIFKKQANQNFNIYHIYSSKELSMREMKKFNKSDPLLIQVYFLN